MSNNFKDKLFVIKNLIFKSGPYPRFPLEMRNILPLFNYKNLDSVKCWKVFILRYTI